MKHQWGENEIAFNFLSQPFSMTCSGVRHQIFEEIIVMGKLMTRPAHPKSEPNFPFEVWFTRVRIAA